jgi:hypothetical protein
MTGPDPRILLRLADAKQNIERALAFEGVSQNVIFQDYVALAIRDLDEVNYPDPKGSGLRGSSSPD